MAEDKKMSNLCYLRMHKNASKVVGTNLIFPEHETISGMCAVCLKEGSCDIGKKARTGNALFPEPFGTAQFGAEKRIASWEDIQIIPELYGEGVFFDDVKTETEIGGFKLKLPAVLAAMGSTEVAHVNASAMAAGAAKAGVAISIGENILASYGDKGLKERIQPFLDNYDGKSGAVIVQGNVEDQKQNIFQKAKDFGAMGIELKLGQGAKQGLGGEIQFASKEDAEKYRKIGYRVDEEKKLTGEKYFERHSFPGSLGKEDLREKLIEYAELGLPIWAKVAMGKGILKLIDDLNAIKKEQGIPFKCLTVDGFGGGTGMSPWLIMNENCLPSICLMGLLKEKPAFDILLAGNCTDGADIAKALMLGASGIAIGRAILIAANLKDGSVEKYLQALQREVQMLCATQRLKDVNGLKKKKGNLLALSSEAATLFNLPANPKDVL